MSLAQGISCLSSSVSWVSDVGNFVVLGDRNFRGSTVARRAVSIFSSTSRFGSEKPGQMVLEARTNCMHVSRFRDQLHVHM